MLIVKEEDKNVPPYSSKALVLNASPRFRSRAWDFRKCGLFVSIRPSSSEQSWKKMNLRTFSSAIPSVVSTLQGIQKSCLHIWLTVGKFLPQRSGEMALVPTTCVVKLECTFYISLWYPGYKLPSGITDPPECVEGEGLAWG